MNTGSVVIKALFALFSKLNYFFEYSFIYALCLAVKKAARGSVIFRGLSKPVRGGCIEGSFLMSAILFVFKGISAFIKRLYGCLSGINANSINKRVYDRLIVPLTGVYGAVAAFFTAAAGVFIPVVVFFAFRGSLAAAAVLMLTALICGLIGSNPQLTAVAFKKCALVRIIKWFFIEE